MPPPLPPKINVEKRGVHVKAWHAILLSTLILGERGAQRQTFCDKNNYERCNILSTHSTLRSWLVATLCVYFLSLLLTYSNRIFLLTAWTGHSDVYGRSNKGCAEFHLDPTAPTSSVKRRWIVCTSGPSKTTSRHRYIFRSLSVHFPLIYRSFSSTFSFSFYKDLAKIT